MRYKIYIIAKSDELIYKKSYDTLDECIEGLQVLIPHIFSRKIIDMIIIRRREE